MLLEVVPGEHLQELLEVLLDLLHRVLALVDGVEPALEERLGHLQTGLGDQVVAQLQREEVVALAAQLPADLGIDERVELGLRGHVARGERHLEELLRQLGVGEAADLGDLKGEFRVDALQLVLLDLEHGGTLRRVLVQLVHIDRRLVAHLLADEGLALLLRHRHQAHVGVLHLHRAVVERHAQGLVRGHLLGIDQTAEAAQEVGAVVVVHLLLDGDGVVGQLILLRESESDGRSLADLEHELEFGAVLEVEVALLLRRDHVAQVVDVLLLEVLEHGVRSRAVRLLGQHALAVHLLHDAHGHHAGAEARDVGLTLVLAERLLDRLAVILLAHGDPDQRGVLFALFSYDIHNCMLFCYFPFICESARKDIILSPRMKKIRA